MSISGNGDRHWYVLSHSGRHLRVNYPTCTCGAHTLLRRFLAPGADQRALTLSLRPTRADYVLLLVTAMACRAEEHYRPMWEEVESGRPLVEVEPHRTEILLWAATSEDLRSGNGEARHFPAECFRVAPFLRPHQTLYRFKFVQPGTTDGSTYDGLVRARHRWVLLPEPWQLLDAAR